MCLDVFWEQLGKHPHKQVRNIPVMLVCSLELLHPKQEMVSFSLVVNIYKIIDLNSMSYMLLYSVGVFMSKVP